MAARNVVGEVDVPGSVPVGSYLNRKGPHLAPFVNPIRGAPHVSDPVLGEVSKSRTVLRELGFPVVIVRGLKAHGSKTGIQRSYGSYDPEEDQSGLDNGLLLDSSQAGKHHLRLAYQIIGSKRPNSGFEFLPLRQRTGTARFQRLSRFLASVCYK